MKRFLSIGEAMVELSRSAVGDELWRQGFAGDTLNTAWYLRACLPDTWQIDYLTRLGQDPFSPRLLEFLREGRIRTDYVSIDPVRSVGLYAIELHEGERSFAYWRGQSAARLLADDTALLDRAFAEADAVYLSGITLAILPEDGRKALISRLIAAREKGKLTAFDPNLRPRLWDDAETMRRWLTRAAAGAQIVLPSFDDEARWFGDASSRPVPRVGWLRVRRRLWSRTAVGQSGRSIHPAIARSLSRSSVPSTVPGPGTASTPATCRRASLGKTVLRQSNAAMPSRAK